MCFEILRGFHSFSPNEDGGDNYGNAKSSTREADFSLARLLLSVEYTQATAACFFINKLPEINANDENDGLDETTTHRTVRHGQSLSRVLLLQFKWLIVFYDNSATITETLLGILSAISSSLQRDVIMLIPEIVSDGEHEAVVEALENIICESNDLMLPVLDALSNLNLNMYDLADSDND